MAAPSEADLKTEELIAIIREIRDRVRARYPDGVVAGVAVPDLMPLVHARDAAGAKAAAIGSVNPRPPGLVNNAVQAVKRTVARLLDWHVRDQVEFNRAVVGALDAALESLNDLKRIALQLNAAQMENTAVARQHTEMVAENNRLFADSLEATKRWVEARIAEADARAAEMAKDLGDLRAHWAEWRPGFEHKLAQTEAEYLKSVAEMQAMYQHKLASIETSCRDLLTLKFEKAIFEIQQRTWNDIERIRAEVDRIVHTELKLVRQRAMLAGTAPAAAPPHATIETPAAPEIPHFDYIRFEERFRGSEEDVRERQRFYVPWFRDAKTVLDVGCGRGEFLELMREAGIPASGIDSNPELAGLCRAKGLEAEHADLFAYLAGLADGSLGGIFCAQVVEHIPPGRLPDMIRLAAAKLAQDGVLAIETPNPECLAIFASHFYLDPTHQRPVPAPLLIFHLEECGMGKIRLHKLSPALDSMPALASLPEEMREAFFGGLDYAVIARKL